MPAPDWPLITRLGEAQILLPLMGVLRVPPTRTHDLVIRLSLWVSGHERPHERTLPRPPAPASAPPAAPGRTADGHAA